MSDKENPKDWVLETLKKLGDKDAVEQVLKIRQLVELKFNAGVLKEGLDAIDTIQPWVPPEMKARLIQAVAKNILVLFPPQVVSLDCGGGILVKVPEEDLQKIPENERVVLTLNKVREFSRFLDSKISASNIR